MSADSQPLFERLWSGEAAMEEWTATVSGGVANPVTEDVIAVSTSYLFGNVTAVRTAEGLVLIDTGSRDTAHETFAAVRRWDPSPVHTIVFTHGHIDHTWGARLYDREADERGMARPNVVAHRSVLTRFQRYDETRDLNSVVMGRQFNKPDYVFPDAHRRPDAVYDEELSLTIGGVRFDLKHGRGETDDATFVWLPDQEILVSGDFVIWVFPNAGNPRKVQRFAPDWAAALRRMRALKPRILLPGHGPAVLGQDRAAQVLEDGALVLESLVQQTRALMNTGSTLDECLHQVRAPQDLLSKPYLRPKYDDPEFVVRGIWHLYGGWFDGNPAHLKPAPQAELGAELVALCGGNGKLVARARELAASGRTRLAAHLIEYAAADSPENTGVQTVRAAVYGKCMEAETSLIGKAIFAVYQREALRVAGPAPSRTLEPPVTVYQAFSNAVAVWHDRAFFHVPSYAAKGYSATAIEWTYGQAGKRIAELAAQYALAGLQAGWRVGLLLGNRVEFFLHYLAINSLGSAVVPLSAEATAAELVHILRDSRAGLVVALAEHRKLLEDAFAGLDKAPAVAWLDGDGNAAIPALAGPSVAAHDEAALLYTSGSTGDPKGCIIPNSYMLAMGRWYRELGGLCALKDGQERLITPLPLMHMNALAASGMGMIMSGGCIVQLDRFHPSTWWDSVRESRATIVHYLGVMPAMLLQMPASPLDMAHQVKFGFGAGVHPKHHAAFEQRFGFPLVESWSMTEVGAGAVVTARHEPRHVGTRCFGKPEPFMEYRIVDDQGSDVAPGAAGEFWVRAAGANPRAGFFAGYANQPALTEAAWEHDFFHTGDIVRVGEDGSLHFVDRKKSIIRRSGENIASLEVEAVLNQLPQVRGVGVGPVDDELRGEEVMACIELAAGHAATAETAQAIFAAAAHRLVYFKLPGYVAFVQALPLTASQKLQRGVLKTLSHALVEGGNVFDLRAQKRRPTKPETGA